MPQAQVSKKSIDSHGGLVLGLPDQTQGLYPPNRFF
jgi:hypothetical protein